MSLDKFLLAKNISAVRFVEIQDFLCLLCEEFLQSLCLVFLTVDNRILLLLNVSSKFLKC